MKGEERNRYQISEMCDYIVNIQVIVMIKQPSLITQVLLFSDSQIQANLIHSRGRGGGRYLDIYVDVFAHAILCVLPG